MPSRARNAAAELKDRAAFMPLDAILVLFVAFVLAFSYCTTHIMLLQVVTWRGTYSVVVWTEKQGFVGEMAMKRSALNAREVVNIIFS